MRRAGVLTLAAGAVAALTWGFWAAQGPPAGPVPVAWDRVRCARCGMLVSEPAFAAQLQRADGSVLDFDDPGCLLLYRDEHRDEDVHAVWLHLHDAERWVRETDARFQPVATSPMGYGLATRSSATPLPGALDAQAALAYARDRETRAREAESRGVPR